MRVHTILLRVFIVYFIDKFIENEVHAVLYNPLLTYVVRLKYIKLLPNFTGSLSIHQYNQKEYFNGYLKRITTDPVDNVEVIFHRCDSEGINCDYFQTWEITDICNKLKEKNQIWSSTYDAFDPPMQCPINKMCYEIKNATIDINPIRTWYPNCIDYQWKIWQKFYARNVYMGGYLIHFSTFGYRKKTNKPII